MNPSASNTEIVTLGLGSNLGDRFKNITTAIIELVAHPEIRCIETSSIYNCPAIGFEGPSFLNLVIQIETTLDPDGLLIFCQKIEKKLGKTVRSNRESEYKSRTIDIDLLTFGNKNIHADHLTLPHPEIKNRDFVKFPMLELKVSTNYLEELKAETSASKGNLRELHIDNTLSMELKSLLSLTSSTKN